MQLSDIVLVIDPGHGGKDPGALGPALPGLPRLTEAAVVLDVAGRLKKRVEARGIQIVMTREDDRFVELSDRARLANRFPAASTFFLSIHCNSSSTPASGFEVFTSPGETRSDPFATDLFNAYAFIFDDLKARKELGDGDPDKEAKFTVLTRTAGPAALFELEFIHTPEGDAFFRDDQNLDSMAEALELGFIDHLARLGIDVPGDPEPVPTDPDDLDPAASPIAEARRKLTEGNRLIAEGLALLG